MQDQKQFGVNALRNELMLVRNTIIHDISNIRIQLEDQIEFKTQ